MPNLSLVFLTAVLLVAVLTAIRPALIAAAYNFFFTEPRFTLAMHRTHELATVGFFLIMGLIGGQLAGRLRHQVLALAVPTSRPSGYCP